MAIYIIFLVLISCFAVVLLFGAPYLPTHKHQIELSIDMLGLKKGQTLYELGCGDGRVLRHAASKGYKAVGYEMNPLLWITAIIVTWRYRKSVSVRFGNFWYADLENADGVYVFLLDKFMKRLDKKLSQELRKGVKLASYTFQIPSKKATSVKGGVFLYTF